MVEGLLKVTPGYQIENCENLSIARAMGANPTVIQKWFDLLENIKSTKGIHTPCQIWSGDETGVQNVPKERRC